MSRNSKKGESRQKKPEPVKRVPDAFDINEALKDISTKLKWESQIDLSEQTRKKTKVELIRVIDNENSSSRAFSDRDMSISNSEASSQLNAISKAAVVAT